MENRGQRLQEMQLKKLLLQVNCRGSDYNVYRKACNEFGEPIKDKNGNNVATFLKAIKGLYHTNNSFVRKTISETAVTKSKNDPMLLTVYDQALDILLGDIIMIDGVLFTVTESTDLSLMHIACDISLVKGVADGVVV